MNIGLRMDLCKKIKCENHYKTYNLEQDRCSLLDDECVYKNITHKWCKVPDKCPHLALQLLKSDDPPIVKSCRVCAEIQINKRLRAKIKVLKEEFKK